MMEETKWVDMYRKWVLARSSEEYPISENEKGNLEIESNEGIGVVNFYEENIVELRINSITAGKLENTLKESYDSVSKIILDFKDLEYISSAGLRVVLAAYKAMTGNLVVRNSSKGVMEVFEMTGFTNIVTFE